MTDSRRSLLPSLGAQALFLLTQLRRQRLAKIFRREHLAELDLIALAERRALHPVDRFVERFGLDQPEAGDEIAGEVERAAAHGGLIAVFDPHTLRCRMQTLARLDHAGLG